MKKIIQYMLVWLTMLVPQLTWGASDVSSYDYALYTTDLPAMAGRQMVMALSMKNATLISAYQADLVLPEGFSIATTTDENGDETPLVTLLRTLPSRHSLSISRQADGSYRLLSTSLSNKNYGGYDGPVAYITINVADGVDDGDYQLLLANQELVEVTNVAHNVAATQATITVRNAQTVLDKPETDISITDLSGITDMLYTPTLKAYRGKQAKVELRMRNSEAVAGFQADLLLPTGFTLAKDDAGNPLVQLGSRTDATRHAINVAQQADGSYRVIVISASNKTFAPGDGVVAELTFLVAEDMKRGEYRVIVRQQELAKPDNSRLKPENVTAKVKVEVPGFTYDMIHLEPYLLYTCNKAVQAGGQVTLHVGMLNKDIICGFQTDLVLPEGVTVATTLDAFGDEVPMITYAGRTTPEAHSIQCVKQDEGIYRILCASTSNKTLSGHLGDVFQITLNVAPTVKDKMYSIYFINQEFGEADNSRHLSAFPFVSRLFVRDGKPTMGDVDTDGEVDATDVMSLVRILLHNDAVEYNEEAGDTNEDGHFSIIDIMKLIQQLKN